MEDTGRNEANEGQGGRKRKWDVIGSVSDVSANGWEQERVDADSLLRCLHQAHVEKESLRKYLRGRWPRWPGDDSCGHPLDAERFIAESFLRDQDFDAITSLVSRTVGCLGQDCPDEIKETVDVSATISRLSDDGVLEALPKYLPRLQGKALCSVLSILAAKESKAKNVPWLIKRINEEWVQLSRRHPGGNTKISRSVLAVLRDPRSFRKEGPPVHFVIDASSPLTAVYSAFSQLEKLPLRCSQVMLEILVEKPVGRRLGTLPVGGNKDRVTSRLASIVGRLLSEHQPGEALPALVQKSLVVASVSARFAFGHDGNLMDFLGPIPSEVTTLHDRLLTALTDLKAMNHGNLKQVYSELSGEPMLQDNRHSVMLRKPIRNVILDCLLRSEVRPVPDNIKDVLKTIRELAREQAEGEAEAAGNRPPQTSPTDQVKIEREVEAVLVMSSHMQQIMLNWNELASGRLGPNHRLRRITTDCDIKAGPVKDTSRSLPSGEVRLSMNHHECISGFAEKHPMDGVRSEIELNLITATSTGKTKQGDELRENGTLECTLQTTQREIDSHGFLLEDEEDYHRLRRVADETAEIGYTLVGCAMERVASASGVSLNKRVQNYLRGDMIKNVPASLETEANAEQNQLDMILAIAESIPAVSSRTMTNVKRRLGVG